MAAAASECLKGQNEPTLIRLLEEKQAEQF